MEIVARNVILISEKEKRTGNLIFPELGSRLISSLILGAKSVSLVFEGGDELEIRMPTAQYYFDVSIKNWLNRKISEVTAVKAKDEGYDVVIFKFENVLVTRPLTHVLSLSLNDCELRGEPIKGMRA
ncbi:MAG: hypothetical protein AAB355_03045 [Patescibacteria group bacterium]